MIYPNKTESIKSLEEYVTSNQYVVFAEEIVDEPKDWDWKKQGFYRGPRIEITTIEQLKDYIFNDKYTICYDTTEEYSKFHMHKGESKFINNLRWEYNGGDNRYYVIRETKNFNKNQYYYELVKFEDDFSFTLGSWESDSDGYKEFKSVGSRMFDYINEDDVSIVWSALKKFDEYLNKGFKNE